MSFILYAFQSKRNRFDIFRSNFCHIIFAIRSAQYINHRSYLSCLYIKSFKHWLHPVMKKKRIICTVILDIIAFRGHYQHKNREGIPLCQKIRKQNGAYKMKGFHLFLFLVRTTQKHTGFRVFSKSYWFAGALEAYTLRYYLKPIYWAFFEVFFNETRQQIQRFSSKCFLHRWRYFNMDRKQKYGAGETPTRFYCVTSIYLSQFRFHSLLRPDAPQFRR